MLCALPNDLPYSRFGFAVNSRIGNAVRRNRIKRRLREIMRLQQDEISPGWDIVLIARQPIRSADYHEMETACARLLRRAQLFPTAVDASQSLETQSQMTPAPESENYRAS